MWTVKSHLETHGHLEFETRQDAHIEMHKEAEDLAEIMGAHVFHDNIGLSTVFDPDDDETYVCFWVTER